MRHSYTHQKHDPWEGRALNNLAFCQSSFCFFIQKGGSKNTLQYRLTFTSFQLPVTVEQSTKSPWTSNPGGCLKYQIKRQHVKGEPFFFPIPVFVIYIYTLSCVFARMQSLKALGFQPWNFWWSKATRKHPKLRTQQTCLLGGGFKYFLFSPLFGEDSHFDDHIFQMGWNHQPVFLSPASGTPQSVGTAIGDFEATDRGEVSLGTRWVSSENFLMVGE